MADSGLTEFVSSGASPAPNFLLEEVDVDAPKGAERHGPIAERCVFHRVASKGPVLPVTPRGPDGRREDGYSFWTIRNQVQ